MENNLKKFEYLLKDGVKILSILSQRKKLTSTMLEYQKESLNFSEFFAEQMCKIYVDDVNLFFKIEGINELSESEKSGVSNHIVRRCMDILSKVLYVSQLEEDKKGLFVLSQILREVMLYSLDNPEREIYAKLDKKFRESGKDLLEFYKLKLPETVGLSKGFLIKNNLSYPAIEQIFLKCTPNYAKDHGLFDLKGQEIYKIYAFLSEYSHAQLTANKAIQYSSSVKYIGCLGVPTRMMLEILNTYYYDSTFSQIVTNWVEKFNSTVPGITNDWLNTIKKVK